MKESIIYNDFEIRLANTAVELNVLYTMCEDKREEPFDVLTDESFNPGKYRRLFRYIRKQFIIGNGIPPWKDSVGFAMKESLVTQTLASPRTKYNDAELALAIEQLIRFQLIRGFHTAYKEDYAALVGEPDNDILKVSANFIGKLNEILKGGGDPFETRVHYGPGWNMKDIYSTIFKRESEDNIPTTFPTYDAICGGMPRKGLWTVAATTGSGKSMFINTICARLARRNFKVVDATLEMDAESMEIRHIASETGVPVDVINNMHMSTNAQRKTVQEYMQEIQKESLNYETDSKTGKPLMGNYITLFPKREASVDELLTTCLRLEPDIIAVDHAALVGEVTRDPEWERLYHQTRKIHDFSLMHGIPVILAAQADDNGKLRYTTRIKDLSELMWWWDYDEQAKETGELFVKQYKCRRIEPFPFKLPFEPKYGRMGEDIATIEGTLKDDVTGRIDQGIQNLINANKPANPLQSQPKRKAKFVKRKPVPMGTIPKGPTK